MNPTSESGPETGADRIDLCTTRGRALVAYATKAASSHNTQPWLFRLHRHAVEILPDFSRRCPAVDPDDHHLYASLGCAAENLLIAAQADGLRGRMASEPGGDGLLIEFESAEPKRPHLFDAIERRQCSRTEYDGSELDREHGSLLESAGHGQGVATLLITDRGRIESIARFVERGNSRQFDDPAWVRELKSWIRFNRREAERHGDGLYGPAMGNPEVPRWLGKLAMQFAFSAKKQNRKDRRHILSSSAVAVIHSERDDPAHWIEAGRCYQRLALQATALGLKTAFINQPVEVAELRPEFGRHLGLVGRRIDLVVRVGRGPDCPQSFRRSVEAALV